MGMAAVWIPVSSLPFLWHGDEETKLIIDSYFKVTKIIFKK